MVEVFDPFQLEFYFYRDLTRQKANDLLKCSKVGSFLVRTSTSDPSNLSLSLRVSYDEDNPIRHYFIKKTKSDSGKPIVSLNGQDFPDLPYLIQYFSAHFLGQTVLLRPAPKETICKVIGRYRFFGERTNDLPFGIDETLEIISKPEEFWWVARNALGNIGLVPTSYINEQARD